MSTRYKRIGCCSVQTVFKLKRTDLSAHVLKLIRSSTPTGAIPIVLMPKARYAILLREHTVQRRGAAMSHHLAASHRLLQHHTRMHTHHWLLN